MFTNPLLLWGLFFAAVPLAIHLINLLRHRPVEWGAMEFLLAAYKKHRTRMRMKELLLLLMRMGLIVLLVLLLAGPVIQSFLPGSGKTHHLVILDDSFSMTDRLGETSVFQNAKDSIQKLIDDLSQQSGIHNLTLVRTSQSREGMRQTVFHSQRISRSFRDAFSADMLSPAFTSGGMEDALRYAKELAPETDGDSRILYLVSDFRARDWKTAPALAAQMEELVRSGFRIRMIDCVPGPHPNLGVSGLAPQEGTRAAGVPLLLSTRVTNFGTSVVRDAVLHPEIFQIGTSESFSQKPAGPETEDTVSPHSSSTAVPSGSQAQTASMNQTPSQSDPADTPVSNDALSQTLPPVTIPEIPAGGSVTVSFPVTFPRAGNFGVRVSLPPDPISPDNQAYAALSIPQFEPILLIDDSLDGSTSRFLRTALAPGDRVRTGIVPRVEKARFLSTSDLSAFRSIYLLDTAALEPQAVTALEDFVQNGGGLCLFTGPHTDPIQTLKWYRDGKGFFPVILDQTQELPAYYASPDIRVARHPIFRIFSGENASQFSAIRVERYFTLDDSTLETLIPLEDETSAIQKARADEPNTPSASVPAPEADTETSGEEVRVLAALRNNSPLVVERRFGKGKVVLFLTTADRTWTDWPVGDPSRPNPFSQGSYVVMALQLQAYLTSTAVPFWRVGDSLTADFPSEKFEASVPFRNPDATIWERFTAVPDTEGRLNVQSAPTSQPGIFSAELKGLNGLNEERIFAVNTEVQEGETEKISRDALFAELPNVPFEYVSAEDFRFSASDAARSLLSDWILTLVLLWLLLEMLLAASASWHLSGSDAVSLFSGKRKGSPKTGRHSGTGRFPGSAYSSTDRQDTEPGRRQSRTASKHAGNQSKTSPSMQKNRTNGGEK